MHSNVKNAYHSIKGWFWFNVQYNTNNTNTIQSNIILKQKRKHTLETTNHLHSFSSFMFTLPAGMIILNAVKDTLITVCVVTLLDCCWAVASCSPNRHRQGAPLHFESRQKQVLCILQKCLLRSRCWFEVITCRVFTCLTNILCHTEACGQYVLTELLCIIFEPHEFDCPSRATFES